MNNVPNEQGFGITIDGRKSIKVFSIFTVDSFDENQISVTLKDGECLVIDGTSLQVRDVNLEKGIVEAEGTINGVNYYVNNPVKRSGGIKGFLGIK